jgi:GT2 family glycosyltransferase
MMTRIPVAGVVWQTVHYLLGFARLGYDVHYVETHARTPSMLMEREEDDSGAIAAAFIDRVMRRYDLGDRWAYYALHDDSRIYGMSKEQLHRLYDSASLLINLHGGTEPLPEFAETGRLVYLETDPVQLQVELHYQVQATLDFLEPHCAFFTFAENYGNPDCKLPASDQFHFHPTRQPVVLDFWQGRPAPTNEAFTTVGNWKQPWREVWLEGETYSWSKHHEFMKIIDLPQRTAQPFELALSSYEDDREMLEAMGWRVRHALDFSTDPDAYRDYIADSRGELTVAKDQNVRLRTGWFSDRSATYLAAGRPVISQDTGFTNVLPNGEGLFGFSTIEEALEAVERVNADYERNSAVASAIAADYFSADVVLSQLLDDVGLERARAGRKRAEAAEAAVAAAAPPPFPGDMVLSPLSRRPTRLLGPTIETVLERPIPVRDRAIPHGGSHASIVIVTYDNLVFTRLCIESLIAHTETDYELIVVDNASSDGTREYLREVAEHHSQVQVVLNDGNLGFPHACNQGLALASGANLVLLNDDTIVPPGWLSGLISKLEDPKVGMVGPVTNRIGNEAEIEAPYRTWGELLEFSEGREHEHEGETFEIRMLAMFCIAMRRDTYELVGPLDERFEVGLLEDDDYSMRVRQTGRRLLCAEDVFVHHFGETSFGKLVPTGEYTSLLAENQRRFEEKWGTPWQPYGRRLAVDYEDLTKRIRRLVAGEVPADATVLVVSRGDEGLLALDGRRAWHFPAAVNGNYAGHHPADSAEAISHLEDLRERGGSHLLIPKTGMWWLDHYKGLRRHLESRYRLVVEDEETCKIFQLDPVGEGSGGDPR